jgi:hypothetical protein
LSFIIQLISAQFERNKQALMTFPIDVFHAFTKQVVARGL